MLQEISGRTIDTGEFLESYPKLAADGSTLCGCWIYCGVFKDGINQAARKKPHRDQGHAASEWGWAWPANRRLIYNRASADPEGRPWSERKRYVWWDADEQKWTGLDVPDFQETRRRLCPAGRGESRGRDRRRPPVRDAGGRPELAVRPAGLEDGPLPTHYEPHESPFANSLYAQRANPARQQFERPENPYNRSTASPAPRSTRTSPPPTDSPSTTRPAG